MTAKIVKVLNSTWVEFSNTKGDEITFWIEKDGIQIDVDMRDNRGSAQSFTIPFDEFKQIINEIRKQGVDV